MELVVEAGEIGEKDRRIRGFLGERGLAGLVLSGTRAFAWAACGRDNHVVKGAENGVGHALYTLDAKYLLCDNIEEARLRDEERLEEQGFTFMTGPWYTFDLAAEVRKRVPSGPIGADTPLPGATLLANRDLAPLRYALTPQERERYRWLGSTTAAAMEATAGAARPGMTEHQVGAVLDHHLEDAGVVPWLTLVASDERIARYRHPIPTGKTVERYVMYITGASRWGLIACATRLVHFGPLGDELARTHHADFHVEPVINAHTPPRTPEHDNIEAPHKTYDERASPRSGRGTTRAGRPATRAATTRPSPASTRWSRPTRRSRGTRPSPAPRPRTPSSPATTDRRS